jgi:adenosylhomocysteinase
VIKIQPLILGGANVDVRVFSLLPPVQEAVNLLNSLKINVVSGNYVSQKYDFHLDCCAELINLSPPKIGAVELTKTGGDIYKPSEFYYPMISVDDSPLKFLETYFGTGDGFVRALRETRSEKLYDKKFIIFGYGKVGRGIVGSLLKFTDNIVVIDIDPSTKDSAIQKGIKLVDGLNRDLVKEVIKDAYCIVTASGVKGLLTDYYELHEKDFGYSLLANMGADDEYGHNFSESRVLFSKKTFNFCIDSPTSMKYLDPIFYAHNYGIDIILSKKIKNGYNALPIQNALQILEDWAWAHGEELPDLSKYY